MRLRRHFRWCTWMVMLILSRDCHGLTTPTPTISDSVLLGQSVSDAHELSEKEARFVAQSLWHSRETIHSASVEANVKWEGEDVLSDKRTMYRFYCDFTNKRLRVDHKSEGGLWQTIKRPECVLVHPAHAAVISRYPPDFAIAWEEASLLDVRVLGITQIDAVWNGTLEDLHRSFSQGKPRVWRTSGGEYVIVWEEPSKQFPALTTVTRVWANEQYGFAPTRIEQTFGMNGRFPPQPEFVTESQYINHSGAFVPTLCEFNVIRNGAKQPKEIWNLEWQQVNTELPEKLFTPEGLDAPGGTLVADLRTGKPIIESEIPRDGIDDLPGGPPKLLGKTGLLGASRKWMLLLNGIVIVFLMAILLFKRLQPASRINVRFARQHPR